MAPAADFYLRYYVGHKGKFGHEFLEFEFRPDGQVTSGIWLSHVSMEVYKFRILSSHSSGSCH